MGRQTEVRICLDFDGLLNDQQSAWAKWVHERFGRRFELKDIPDYDFVPNLLGPKVKEFWMEPGHYAKVSPLPGAREFVDELTKLVGTENLSICTSTPELVISEKNSFIKEHFDIPSYRVTHSYDKAIYTKGAVLIDDYKINILHHVLKNSAPGILFDNGGTYGWSSFTEEEMLNIPSRGRNNILFTTSYKEIMRCVEGLMCGY
jgi:5'(3')-deoxyribonucleotidase